MALTGKQLADNAAALASMDPPIPYRNGGDSLSGMDCQGMVEYCMRAEDWNGNWKGSNAMFRACTWTGTPEDCKKEYGRIPIGAMLFILTDDGGEVSKGYTDGLGNATHVGIYTGTNEGAVHASSSRGCVAWSKFQGKTIKNGGWNRIGLMADIVDYGLRDPDEETVKVVIPLMATVQSSNGGGVRLRMLATKSSDTICTIPEGAQVELLESGDLWSKVSYEGRKGYAMTEFLVPDESSVSIVLTLTLARSLRDALDAALEGGET